MGAPIRVTGGQASGKKYPLRTVCKAFGPKQTSTEGGGSKKMAVEPLP